MNNHPHVRITIKYTAKPYWNTHAGKYLNLDDYNIDNDVTQKTTDDLLIMIVEEKQKIRNNPVERTSDILKSVFGTN